jgi:hypothetical protein
MKACLTPALLLALVPPLASAGQAAPGADSWQVVGGGSNTYSIEMPSAPQRSVEQSEEDEVGSVLREQYVASAGDVAFMSQCLTYPEGVFKEEYGDIHLEIVLESIFKGSGGGELVSNRVIEGSKLDGRRMVFKPKGLAEAVLVVEVYFTPRRVYQFQAISASGDASDPAITRFFSSLRFSE